MVTRGKNNRDRAEDGYRDLGRMVAKIILWASIVLLGWAGSQVYQNSIEISIISTQTREYQENSKAERGRMRRSIRRLEDHQHKE